jgi:hypothetical protein
LNEFLETRKPSDAYLAAFRYRLATAVRGKDIKKQVPKPLKDAGKPKRPLPAGFLFLQHVNSLSPSAQETHLSGVSLEGKSMVERSQIVATVWKRMSAADKEVSSHL